MPKQKPGGPSHSGGSRESGDWWCVYDGAILDTLGDRRGWCPEGKGYALAYRVWVIDDAGSKTEQSREVLCPFACPICYAPLSWDGGCDRCHGSRTSQDRETWTFPGARYELARDRHYRWVAAGPRPVARESEVSAIIAGMKRDLAKLSAKSAILERPVHPSELPAWVTAPVEDPEGVPF